MFKIKDNIFSKMKIKSERKFIQSEYSSIGFIDFTTIALKYKFGSKSWMIYIIAYQNTKK